VLALNDSLASNFNCIAVSWAVLFDCRLTSELVFTGYMEILLLVFVTDRMPTHVCPVLQQVEGMVTCVLHGMGFSL